MFSLKLISNSSLLTFLQFLLFSSPLDIRRVFLLRFILVKIGKWSDPRSKSSLIIVEINRSSNKSLERKVKSIVVDRFPRFHVLSPLGVVSSRLFSNKRSISSWLYLDLLLEVDQRGCFKLKSPRRINWLFFSLLKISLRARKISFIISPLIGSLILVAGK